MKKQLIILIVFILTIPVISFSQDTLSYPTDIIYIEESEEYYVSNWADTIAPGYILKLNSLGEIIGNFYSDLDYPGGLCRVGDTIYVLNNKDLYGGNLPSYLLGIDLNTGQLVVNNEIGSGGIYVDMITTDNNGNLYITDYVNFKIYKYNIQTQSFSDFVTNINKPFGICYNDIDDEIMFTISSGNISYVASIPPEGGDYSTMFYHLGWLEGIIMAPNGDYYLSSWTSTGSNLGTEPVIKASHPLNWSTVISDTNNRPFGMCIGKNNHLAVCNWGSHIINFIDLNLHGVNELHSQASFNLYPNPSKGNIQVNLSQLEISNAILKIYDISGKELFSKAVSDKNAISEEVNLSFLEKGTYMVLIVNSENAYRQKLIIY